jgi:hypothetical protein
MMQSTTIQRILILQWCMGCWSYCMFLFVVILFTFLVRIFFGGFFFIVDAAYLECGYIFNLLYSHVEFNFGG